MRATFSVIKSTKRRLIVPSMDVSTAKHSPRLSDACAHTADSFLDRLQNGEYDAQRINLKHFGVSVDNDKRIVDILRRVRDLLIFCPQFSSFASLFAFGCVLLYFDATDGSIRKPLRVALKLEPKQSLASEEATQAPSTCQEAAQNGAAEDALAFSGGL